MEQDKLVRMLRVELKKNIKDECQVTHIMSLIRKINEKLQEDKFKTLLFYSNWVLHSELTRKSSVGYVIERFEQHVEPSNNALTVARILKTEQKRFFNLNNLKTELKKFFEENSLPTILCDDKKQWNQFSKLLLNIIEDCPIDCSVISKLIDKMVLTKDNNGGYCYRISRNGTKEISKIKLKYK